MNIVITGASSGFGKAIAETFARQGHNLWLSARRAHLLEALKTALQQQYNIKIYTQQLDVRNKKAVADWAIAIQDTCPRIDVLINNAGLALGATTINNGDTDDWDTMIDTNVKGLLYVSRALMPFFEKQQSGHIINIGSTAGKNVYRNGNVYCATKFAVDAISQAMRIDLLPYNIKVTAINPGMAETEFSIVRYKGDAFKAGQVYAGYTPLKAQDIADTVYYCATLPPHVCINDLTITCTQQADANYKMEIQ
jgi:NADP-dependent 3-hydroxy acid dehydrogenase YdfG